MRETLTALAILLIVLLTAALAAPYFVDWNAQRAFVEARLSHALGQKVTIGGAIDVKLLPTPYLVLDQAVIGGDDGAITMGIRHLHLELSVTPLLHGEFDVVEARLEEPTIRVTLQRDRTLPPLPDAPAFRADVRFDRIAVVDGTLAIADPQSGRTFALSHLDFEAEAESLAGPFKGSGATGASGARTKFRFASTTAQNGKARTRLIVDETPAHAGLDLDGTLTLTGVDNDSLRQRFDGTAAVTGHLDDHGDLLPWRLSGTVHGDPQAATLETGELRLGAEEHSLLLAATGTADLGETPNLHLGLIGKQLDIDRLSAAPPGGEAAKPRLPALVALRGTLAPPLPTVVDVTVATATYAGQTLSNLAGTFALGGAGPIQLAGDGPGGSHVSIDGTVGPTAEASFRGAVALAATDLSSALDWLAIVAPDLGVTRQGVPFRSVEAKGTVAIDPHSIEARDLALRFDRSVLTGTAQFRSAQADTPAVFKADLQAKTLDLDGLPDLSALRTATAATDLDLRLDARGIKVARVGDGTLDAGRIRFALAKTGPHFGLNTFRIEGLGGATIDATATLDPESGTIDAKLDADRLVDSAALLRRVLPSAWSDALVLRAPALAPARLKLAAVLKPTVADKALVPKTVTVAGTLGATTVNAALSPDPADDKTVVITGLASAPEGSVLLRQIGIPSLPLNALGTSRIALDARGPAAGALATTIHAAFGAATIDLAGHLTVAGPTAGGTGTVTVASPDVSPILQSLALAFPDLTGRIPVDAVGGMAWTPAGLSFADLKGHVGGVAASGSLMWHFAAKAEPSLTGALDFDRLSFATIMALSLGPAQPPAGDALWSALPFAVGLIDPPKSALDLKAKTFDLGQGLVATDAHLNLGVSQGLVALKSATMQLAGGRATADLTLRRDGPTVAVEGKLGLADAALDLPSIAGRVSAAVEIAGSGRSALAFIGSLAGTGTATVADLVVPHADPAALPKIFGDVEADRLSVDEDSIVRALDDAAQRPWAVGTRSFALGLAAGVVHADPSSGAGASPADSVSVAVDLRKQTIDERLEQTLSALPKGWSGPPPQIVVTFAGPLKNPRRSLDISALINALATRALARESARIEAYEFDVRERAFFNQRLQSDRRREQERLKAEDDARLAAEAARKAEADLRAQEAAAKLERARKAEEARAAQEQKAARDRAAAEQQAQQRERRDEQRQAPTALPGAERLDQPAFQSPGNPTDPSAAGRY